MIPKNHVLNVKQGNVGSSVMGTVSRTCSIGESFNSSNLSAHNNFHKHKQLHNMIKSLVYKLLDKTFKQNHAYHLSQQHGYHFVCAQTQLLKGPCLIKNKFTTTQHQMEDNLMVKLLYYTTIYTVN